MDEYIFISAIGGLTYNIVPLLELHKAPKESRPDFKDFFYWLPYIVWPLLAGFLLYIYDSPDMKVNKLLAFHIGISAPLIVRKMIEVLPFDPESVKLKDENQ